MTPEEITRTIAEWMGYEQPFYTSEKMQFGGGKQAGTPLWRMPLYTTSLDALQPVLAQFTPEMRDRVVRKCAATFEGQREVGGTFWYFFTLPAATLSRLIAETIKESA